MAGVDKIEDLIAWQEARKLFRLVYETLRESRLAQDFTLRDQVCSAALSGMSNIAEGFGRASSRDFARFLDISRGSLVEVQSIAYAALDVGLISEEQQLKLNQQVARTISIVAGLKKYLKSKSS